MHKIFLGSIFTFLYLLGVPIWSQGDKQNQILQGKIRDSETQEAIFGAKIYFADIHRGTSSDFEGNYYFSELPSIKMQVKITAIGYLDYTEYVDLSKGSEQDFYLTKAVLEKELDEVVITGVSKSTARKKMPLPISTLSAKELQQNSGNNLIESLTQIPGVSAFSTGPGIAKPMIRGLGFNRVVVIHDGIRQEGQQWGDEHGVEIDEYSIDRVEVLKGPASLLYGSDALAGVINFLPKPFVSEGKIRGQFLSNYQTNNGLIGGTLQVGGNHQGKVWDLSYSHKSAHDYRNKEDGFVYNSRYQENSFGVRMGINRSKWYSHLLASFYQLTPGIITGERDTLTGKFVKSFVENGEEIIQVVAPKEGKSYQKAFPYQEIQHLKIVSENFFILPKGSLKTIVGWQQNHRKELEDMTSPEDYELYFKMNTFNYDWRYALPDLRGWEGFIGMNGMYQFSENKGEEFLIPDYDLFDYGIYMIWTKSWHKINFSGGLRYDLRTENGRELTNESEQFEAFHNFYQSLSGSWGMTYQINQPLYLKLNFAKGYRAPNIAELAANGVHEGTANYIRGNLNLKPENSWQVDLAIGGSAEHIDGEMTLFYNRITDYIYDHQLHNFLGEDSLTNGYRTYQYTSGNAHLFGGELAVDIHPHPLDWLHFENKFSYIKAIQLHAAEEMKYLPFIPAPNWSSELKAEFKKVGKIFQRLYGKVEISYHFPKKDIFSAYGTETPTSDYLLLNIGAGTEIGWKGKHRFTFIVNVMNLTDVVYQNHLSRLKYLDENIQTGKRGIFEMGRNVSLKLIVPLF